MCAEDGVELLAHGLLPVTAELVDFVLRDLECLEREGVAGLELTVHIHGGAPVVPGELRAQHGLVHTVFRRHHGVEAQVRQIRAVPDGIGSVMPFEAREHGAVKGVAVGEGELLDSLAVDHEGEREAAAFLGQALHSGKGLEVDRLGLAVDGELVHAREARGHKKVFLVFALASAGDAAGELGVVRDLDEAVAAGDKAGALVILFGVVAVADDAADILGAGKRALGDAAADAAVAQAADAARVGALLDRDRAVAGAVGHEAEIHPARHAARAFALGIDRAAADTVADDRFHGELVFGQAAVREIQIPFGVQLVFDRDRARDAADVAVAVDRAAVRAVLHLAENDRVLDVRIRVVGEDIGLLVAGEQGQRLHGRAVEGGDAVVDLVEVLRHDRGAAAHVRGDDLHRAGHGAQTAGDHVLQPRRGLRVRQIHAAQRLRHRREIARQRGELVRQRV